MSTISTIMSLPKRLTRFHVFLLLLAGGLTALGLMSIFPHQKVSLFLSGFFLSFCAMLGLRHYWPGNWGLVQVLLLAVAARCFLLPLMPGDDLNRYLWEGKCQLHAINPYLAAPNDNQTIALRDQIWQGVNHKEFTTIYGPLAQLLFKTAAFAWYSPFMMKVMIVVFDLGTLLILLLFLKKRKSRFNEALLYAINPLVLFSFAGEGHMESIMLFMLAAALLMHQRAHRGRMFMFLGAACFVKLTALLFIPIFVRKETVRYIPFVLLPALLAIPFGWSGLVSLFTVTARFAAEFSFNGCLFSGAALVLSNQAALSVCTLAFAGVYLWNLFMTPDPVKATGSIALGFLLTSPTAHPWYFTILAMFTVIYPVRSWIALTGTVGIAWLVTFHYWVTGVWREHFYILVITYVPPFILALASRFLRPEYASPGYGTPGCVSVIIPALNEGGRLSECLKSITLPEDVQSEILVVDGESTDTTCAIAELDSRVKLIHAEKGRGIQIAEGVRRSNGDLIVIVHADTCLAPGAVGIILAHCAKYPHLCGGSVATQFNSPDLKFSFITALNNFRSRFTGISFGDQVQFFRRAALPGSFPRVKLMEDIELSLLLKERGVTTVLPCIAKSSTRRWEKRAYTGNMLMVMSLTASFLLRRRCGLLKEENSDFYLRYYGKA